MLRRHRVGRAVQVHHRLRGDFPDTAAVERIRPRRRERGEPLQRQQIHRALAGGGVDPHIGGLVGPVLPLGVEVGQIGEGAPAQEAVADVGHHPLHLPFGAGPAHATETGGQPVMLHEVQVERVPRGAADQLHLGHVVVEQLARPAAEARKGVLMAAEQLRQFHRSRELDVGHPREAKHHHEGRDLDRVPERIGEGAAGHPIDLGLFSRWGLKAHRGFRRGPLLRPEAGEKPPDQIDAAFVSHRTDLCQQPDRREGARGEAAFEIRLERIQLRRRRLPCWGRPRSGGEQRHGVARVPGQPGGSAL